MSKAVCFLITLVMLLGMGAELNASVKTDACSDSFSDFVVDQIQKNFSQTLSSPVRQDDKKSDGFILLYVINQNQGNNSFNKFSNNNKFIQAEVKFENNALFFSDIWRQYVRLRGLSDYKINLNSFIAIRAVNDGGVNITAFI
jgi:hypothetical protein